MADNGGSRRRTGRRGLWVIAGIAGAGAVLAVVGIWHLPDRMYSGTSDGAIQARAALQGGLLTAAAALTAVAGGLIALDETRQANANTHVRELYATAISQLGADSLDIRLGGIYALERIAHDSAADQRTVVEVLSAFVREHTGASDPPPPRPATDVQAALTVLGRLPHRRGIPRADLTDAQLTGARLAEANLADAWLTGARLEGANLTNARLGGANLTGAWLGGANLTGASLYGADLTGARLGGANLTGAWLGGANLTGAWLGGADLTGAWLGGADLTGAWLGGANLTGAWLGGANLTGARLEGADLTRTQLVRAISIFTQMGRTTITRTHLVKTNLTGARLEGADLTDVVYLTAELVAELVATAVGDARTRLPDGVARPASWPPYDPSAGGS